MRDFGRRMADWMKRPATTPPLEIVPTDAPKVLDARADSLARIREITVKRES